MIYIIDLYLIHIIFIFNLYSNLSLRRNMREPMRFANSVLFSLYGVERLCLCKQRLSRVNQKAPDLKDWGKDYLNNDLNFGLFLTQICCLTSEDFLCMNCMDYWYGTFWSLTVTTTIFLLCPKSGPTWGWVMLNNDSTFFFSNLFF